MDTLFGFEPEETPEAKEQADLSKQKRLLSAKDLKKLAKWNDFICTIDTVDGKDRVFVTWEGNFFSHDLGWLTEIQVTYKTPSSIIQLFNTTKKKAEEAAQMGIKVLVSTEETQGQRENDFCFVPAGEIVDFKDLTCSNETTDGHCGCKRSMYGIECLKSTTTMKVAEFNGSIEDLGKLINKSQQDGGWLQDPWQKLLESGISHASKIAEQASRFSVGTVVEYRDGQLAFRK